MRTAALIAVLLAASLVAPAFAKTRVYRTGVVQKVVFQERPGAPQIELTAKAASPAAMGFVYLTIRAGATSYTGTFYAYRPDDYPLRLRPGQTVRYRISQQQRIECDVHTVMTMRWATVLTLRSPKGHLWDLEIDPLPIQVLPATDLKLSGKKK